jgi:ParB family chromosome partitioning protein
MLRLLTLPSEVKALLDEGQLTAGHARVLVTATDPVPLAKQIVAQGLSVRQIERMASAAKPAAKRKGARSKPGAAARDADTLALERDLSNLLGLKVSINFDGQGAGALTVHYKSLDQLDDLLRRLTRAAGAAKAVED